MTNLTKNELLNELLNNDYKITIGDIQRLLNKSTNDRVIYSYWTLSDIIEEYTATSGKKQIREFTEDEKDLIMYRLEKYDYYSSSSEDMFYQIESVIKYLELEDAFIDDDE
jgi:hypothetical protein